jgi:hypothetical protein
VPEVLGLRGVSFKLYNTCGTNFYFVDEDHKVYPGSNQTAYGHLATMTEATQGEAELGITNLTYGKDSAQGDGQDTYTLIWRAPPRSTRSDGRCRQPGTVAPAAGKPGPGNARSAATSGR